MWMERNFSDFEDEALKKNLDNFCQELAKSKVHEKWGKMLQGTMEKKVLPSSSRLTFKDYGGEAQAAVVHISFHDCVPSPQQDIQR